MATATNESITRIAAGAAVTEPEPDEEDVLNGRQTAAILQVHLHTVQALVRRGELRAAKVGRAYRFKRRWISEYLENCADSAVCG